jgi:hypothetical protein
MAESVYALCGVTSIVCALLLLRGWRASRAPLLFWAGLCFIGLAIDNVVVFIDFVLTPPEVDLFWYRTPPAVAGMLILIYGLVRESK